MDNRAEGFKKKALKYERAAEVATDADVCRMYLDLARQLRVMAEQAEAFERAPTLRREYGGRKRAPASRRSVALASIKTTSFAQAD